jgi:hypothetical protein
MEDRREAVFWGIFFTIVCILFLVMSTCGCTSTEPPPCIPDIQVVEAPPVEIYVVAPRAHLAEIPELESLMWSREQMEERIGEYVDALWTDFQEVVKAWMEDRQELINLNLAREEALADGAVEEVPDQPDPE